jgi:hypothetical protein
MSLEGVQNASSLFIYELPSLCLLAQRSVLSSEGRKCQHNTTNLRISRPGLPTSRGFSLHRISKWRREWLMCRYTEFRVTTLGIPTFQVLTPSPSSGWCWWLGILTPWSRVLFEGPIDFQLFKKFPKLYEKQKVHYHSHKCQPTVPILRWLGITLGFSKPSAAPWIWGQI